jgi:PAS domain S-box-containing protein
VTHATSPTSAVPAGSGAAGGPAVARTPGALLLAFRERQAAEDAAETALLDAAAASAPGGDDAYFQLVFRGSGLGIALVGLDWKPLCSNPALQAMLGYSDAELRSMSFPQLTHPDDRVEDESLHRELLDGVRSGYHFDKRYVARGGRVVHARLTVSRVPGDSSHLIGMVEDVSATWAAGEARDRATRALEERVKELTVLQDATRILQDDRRTIPELLRSVLGILPAAFRCPGSTVARLTAGDETFETPRFGEAVDPLRVAFGPEELPRGALEVGTLPDGSDAAPALLPEKASMLGTLGELILAALDRRRARERLDLAVDAGKVQIWEWDFPTGRVAWPGQAERSPGKGQLGSAASFDEFLSVVHPEDRPRVQEAIRQALEDPAREGRYHAEFRASDTLGRTSRIIASGQVVRDASGTATRMLGVAVDVTERHALEESLRQSQKMESIGQLAGGIAHDFNNLLTVILGFAELAAQSTPKGLPAHGYLEEVVRSGRTAAELVRQLLMFARQQELRPYALSLRGLLGEMESMLSRVLNGRIEFRKDFADDVPDAMADPNQVQRVVLNLAVNARDAMPEGGVLTLRTRKRTCPLPPDAGGPGPAREWAVFEVEDTGTGMSPEVRARLFEPFFTTKSEGRGTGLGLSTVYGIVRQSGGFLEVESSLGKGTLFRVHLPSAAGE